MVNLEHFHDVNLDQHGAGKALERFAAERYDIYKLRDIYAALLLRFVLYAPIDVLLISRLSEWCKLVRRSG